MINRVKAWCGRTARGPVPRLSVGLEFDSMRKMVTSVPGCLTSVAKGRREAGCCSRLGLGPGPRRNGGAAGLGQKEGWASRPEQRRRDFHFFSLFIFQNFQMDFQKGFEFLFTCKKNQSITNEICSSMSASTCL